MQSACLSVCMSVYHKHICGTAGLIFTKFCMQIPWPWLGPPGGIAIRYILPVLWMTSRLAVMGRIAGIAILGRSMMSMNALFILP